jgi:anti-sigma factor RsiW
VSACEAIRLLLHARLDGELPAERVATVEAHLAACAACRAVASGLEAVRSGLRELPEHPLSAAVFEEVLDRTVRARRPRGFRRLAVPWPAWVGAAAVLAFAVVLLQIPVFPPSPGPPSPAEVSRARSEARIAVSLASRALHRAERAAADRVLAGEVAPVLRRLPILWATKPEPRKS